MSPLPSPHLEGKVVLVTGGTGSFGTAFVRTLLAEHDPAAVRVYSRDELKQYDLHRSLGGDERLGCLIGDVRDAERLRMAMQGVDVVIHAAALKQVPACEYNPFEAVKTNINGAAERGRRGTRQRRAAHARALNRQGRQPRQPLRRDEARRREDHHPGQRLRRRLARPLRHDALRQRGRQPRQRDPALQGAGARGGADDHRRGDDPLLDHARAGRRVRRQLSGPDAGRRGVRAAHPLDARERHRRRDRPATSRAGSSASAPARRSTRC